MAAAIAGLLGVLVALKSADIAYGRRMFHWPIPLALLIGYGGRVLDTLT